jgi:transcriptional regulator with XRE-family HTH domain
MSILLNNLTPCSTLYKGVLFMLSIRLADLRNTKGYSQAHIAQQINITHQAYSLYETGKRQMNYDTLRLLADFFEVSTDYLLGRQDAIPSFLSEQEREHMERYRLLSKSAQESVDNVLNFEYSRVHQKENTIRSAM